MANRERDKENDDLDLKGKGTLWQIINGDKGRMNDDDWDDKNESSREKRIERVPFNYKREMSNEGKEKSITFFFSNLNSK